MDHPRYPDLLCIGAQKAATTWLYQMLRNDARVVLPPIKELHYFSQLHDRRAQSYAAGHRLSQAVETRKYLSENPGLLEFLPAHFSEMLDHVGCGAIGDFWYEGFFHHARPDQRCVDICPDYFTLPDAGVAHATALLPPHAQVLILVRDPLDRALSQIRMELEQDVAPPDLPFLVSDPDAARLYLDNSDYRATVTRWEAHAGPGRVQLQLYDDIAERPEAVLARVYDLLDLPPPPLGPAAHQRVFEGHGPALPDDLRARLLAALEPQYAFLEPRLPQAVARWRHLHHAALAAPMV